MNTLKELLFKGWNYLSPSAHIAVIFFFLGMVAAWLIRLL
jgi:hypothetical protein